MATIEKEKDIVLLVENAIQQLKGVSDYAEKENKQVVIDLAKDLEGIIPMDTICTEIIRRLDGHLSPRTIRKYLDEKYKVKSRVDNARKQKNKGSNLAVLMPLNNESRTVVVNDRKEISFQEDNKQSCYPSEISAYDTKDVRSLSQEESLNCTEQKKVSQSQVNTGLTECLGCIDREERIRELEEAHQKIQQFNTANNMGPSNETESLKEKPEEPLEFEVSKKGWEIRNYFRSSKIKSFDETIWFNGRIDRNSGKIIYFGLGRLDQLDQKNVPNRGLD